MPDRDKTETDQGDCARSVGGDEERSVGHLGASRAEIAVHGAVAREPREATANHPLTVETAAIRIGEAVFTLPRPNRHHNVMWWLSTLGIRSGQMHDQGFVLSNGQYVSRTFAAKLALSNGQLEKLISPPDLYSEDLWDGGANLPSVEAIKSLTAAPSSEAQSSCQDGQGPVRAISEQDELNPSSYPREGKRLYGEDAAGEDSEFPRMAPSRRLSRAGYGTEVHRVTAATKH